MSWFLYILGSMLILSTFLPLTGGKHWTIRILDFPRLQLLLFLVLVIVASPFFLKINWWFAGFETLLVAATIVQGIYVFPYLPIYVKDIKGTPKKHSYKPFSILISNVYQYNQQYNKLNKLVQKTKPDFFLAVETDSNWVKNIQKLRPLFKEHVEVPYDNTYGMVFYSCYPFNKSEVQYLRKKYIPSIHATIAINNHKLKFICVHPEPPAPDEAETSIPRDKELTIVAMRVQDEKEPVIVAGDLNDVAWSDTTRDFRKKSHLKDPRRGRGFFNTFHAKYPFFRWSLDHVFVSDHFLLRKMKRGSKIGSDHFPVYLELDFKE